MYVHRRVAMEAFAQHLTNAHVSNQATMRATVKVRQENTILRYECIYVDTNKYSIYTWQWYFLHDFEIIIVRS